jgi:hypothetical protein
VVELLLLWPELDDEDLLIEAIATPLIAMTRTITTTITMVALRPIPSSDRAFRFFDTALIIACYVFSEEMVYEKPTGRGEGSSPVTLLYGIGTFSLGEKMG